MSVNGEGCAGFLLIVGWLALFHVLAVIIYTRDWIFLLSMLGSIFTTGGDWLGLLFSWSGLIAYPPLFRCAAWNGAKVSV